jgi:LPPG:FO 2-phospho-L-lactate transferase
VHYLGSENARPAPGVLESIGEADIVVIAPSNPYVSVLPILAVSGIEEALGAKRVAALSPLVGGKALRGPLAEMMESLGHEPTARGVAGLYGDLVDVFVLDPEDERLAGNIRGALVCPIVMVDPQRRAEVGRKLLEALA